MDDQGIDKLVEAILNVKIAIAAVFFGFYIGSHPVELVFSLLLAPSLYFSREENGD